MRNFQYLLALLICFSVQAVWAAEDVAPAVPDLSLPMEEPLLEPEPVRKPVAKLSASTEPVIMVDDDSVRQARQRRKNKRPAPKPAPASQVAAEPVPAPVALAQAPAPVQQPMPVAQPPVAPVPQQPAFEPARETKATMAKPQPVNKKPQKVVFDPPTQRDPTLSPDDTLLLQFRERQERERLEAERRRKEAEERRRLEELRRQRELELELLRDPSRAIRGKIRISGIIGQEVFIGNKVYTVGDSVLGARIVQVLPEAVVFRYKGQKFTKKVQLK